MRKHISRAAVCIGSVAVLAISAASPAPANPFAFVLYEGVRIPLTRAYADIDEFKDDSPTHLSQSAVAAIERAMLKAKFGPVFRTQAELDASLSRITFPGYGMFYANQLGSKTDSTLELVYVEVPQRSTNRYFALERDSGGSYKRRPGIS
jgi:hypothetical protein